MFGKELQRRMDGWMDGGRDGWMETPTVCRKCPKRFIHPFD
jgi:hypothetical protein